MVRWGINQSATCMLVREFLLYLPFVTEVIKTNKAIIFKLHFLLILILTKILKLLTIYKWGPFGLLQLRIIATLMNKHPLLRCGL